MRFSLVLAAAAALLTQISSATQPGGCGPGNDGVTCLGNPGGESCSQWGYCGPITNPAYGGYGCQPAFGKCVAPACSAQTVTVTATMANSGTGSAQTVTVTASVPASGTGSAQTVTVTATAPVSGTCSAQTSTVTMTNAAATIFVCPTSSVSSSASTTSGSLSTTLSTSISTTSGSPSTTLSTSTSTTAGSPSTTLSTSTSTSTGFTTSTSSSTVTTTSTTATTSSSTSATPTIDCTNRITTNGNPVVDGTGFDFTAGSNGRFVSNAGTPARRGFCIDIPAFSTGDTVRIVRTGLFPITPITGSYHINADVSYGIASLASQLTVTLAVSTAGGVTFTSQIVPATVPGTLPAGSWNSYMSTTSFTPTNSDPAALYVTIDSRVTSTSTSTVCLDNFQIIPDTCPFVAAIA